jgi:hypothetical protein
MTEWIDVKDRLPDIDTPWVTVFDGHYVRPATFCDGVWESWEGFAFDPRESERLEGVTHWIPFPNAPRGIVQKSSKMACKSFVSGAEGGT